jgi:hypothetical protein
MDIAQKNTLFVLPGGTKLWPRNDLLRPKKTKNKNQSFEKLNFIINLFMAF